MDTLNGESDDHRLGYSLSVSGDGQYLATGSSMSWKSSDGNDGGLVQVFESDGIGWTEISRFEGNAGDQLGKAVTISDFGDVLAMSTSGDKWKSDYSGYLDNYVKVYQRDGASTSVSWS